MSEALPPIHELVRFWRGTEAATLRTCVRFRNTTAPFWSLAWLRQAAPFIMTREISTDALRRSVREKVDVDAQASVLKAVELFCAFVEKHKWKGRALSERNFRLPRGEKIKVSPIGRYYSQLTESEWLVALQPRQEDVPNSEQFAMWRSALFYSFCDGEDDVMIVDLSKSPVHHKRQLSEIKSSKYPLLSLTDLEERLDLVVSCYKRSIEIVPERPRREVSKKDDEPTFKF